jgi:phospholipase/lecithinase/hemolysin
MAGGNDLFSQLAAIASGKNPVDALVAMTDAGNELANLVESMVQKGARQVALVNLPDASESPLGRAAGSEIQEVIGGMTRAFNTALKQDLEGNANVLYVDAYALGQQQSANPAQYGLTNTSSPACDLSPEKNPIASSLICTRANVVPGNIDRFRFADTVHPTPYSHQLLADFVSAELTKKGWL